MKWLAIAGIIYLSGKAGEFAGSRNKGLPVLALLSTLVSGLYVFNSEPTGPLAGR